MLIIPGYNDKINVGCISSVITPDLGGAAAAVRFVPLAVLLLTGFAVIYAGIFSPWGSTDVFQWTANYGRDADQLRLITPGFGDCLQYIQFIVLTGGLTISYPGYYQPIVSQMAWSSMMFNESVVTHKPGWHNVVDGIYVYSDDAKYGLHRLGQLVGMADPSDIWAGMMVWLCVIVLGVTVIIQAGFLAQWIYRRAKNIPEEDLREKNIPFSVGNIVRIVFNFLLLPTVSFSTFQLVLAAQSPKYVVALAALTIVVLLAVAAYLLYLIIRTRPKSVLFDDLPTVLRIGPLYNTYSDEAAAFAFIPVLLTFIRGIGIGGLQPIGVAQVVLLAICEVIHVFTLHASKPFQGATSMNAYHTVFCVTRLVGVLLLIAFVPSLGVTEGPKGWIGYAALILHFCVLFFVFFLSTLQTIVEVSARLLGAGGDSASGLKRGGLSKIFGMRQLAKREVHRPGPSRSSQLSTASMVMDPARAGYSPPGAMRSSSGLSMGGTTMIQRQKRSSSALDSPVHSTQRAMDSPTSYIPGTPAEDSTYSFVGSPNSGQPGVSLAALKAQDPWYRPPRRATKAGGDALADQQRVSLIMDKGATPSASGQGLGLDAEAGDIGAEISRNGTPLAPGTLGVNPAISYPPNQPDYATREVDYYYGVRGPALNSDQLGRKLGTGPADPTGPIATASGWIRNMFGGKSKDKTKGFEVVRSSRMPQAMARNGYGDETPPEGIPVATGGIRTGPIESDDDEPVAPKARPRPATIMTEVDDADGHDEHAPVSPLSDDDAPDIPRKSSKRDSTLHPHGHSHKSSLSIIDSNTSADGNSFTAGHRPSLSASAVPPALPSLPFERTQSRTKRPSSMASTELLSTRASTEMLSEDGFTHIDLGTLSSERPASFGMVRQHGVNVHRAADMTGSTAELVDEHGNIKRG